MRQPRYPRVTRSVQSQARRSGKSRQFHIESLEPRCVLAAPTLGALPDVVVAAGAPLHIALDGFDSDGDSLTYSVTSTNSDLTGSIPKQDNPNGNRSMRISVDGYGDMEFELFEGRVPRTTQQMIELAATRWYEGRIFHRIIPNFMIQGGSRDGLGINGSGTTFDDEFHPTLQHTSGNLLSMAKSGDDTNDSQFFITDQSTRWLDFNHSIFGMLTAGEDVRQAIEAIPTDSSDRPLNEADVPVIDSVIIFQDTENGVLMLSAPEGASGEADATITVSDGQGGTAQRTIHVSIQPDNLVDASHNSPPYIEPIDQVWTDIDTSHSFTLDTVDIEGDPVFYSAQVETRVADMDIAVDEAGQVTVTPKNGEYGIFDVTLRAGPSAASVAPDQFGQFNEGQHDAQTIPIFVHPPAPTVELQPVSDTGGLDGITSINNTGKLQLRFMVSGVDPLATVELKINGEFEETTEIGRTPLDDDSGLDKVEVLASTPLNDDVYVVTALQTFQLGEEFGFIAFDGDLSAPILVTIDTQPPLIVSKEVSEAFVGQEYAYQVLAIDGPNNVLKFEIRDPKPDGMEIDADTGAITWTPQAGDDALYSLTVAVVDGAGNEGLQEFDLVVNSTIVMEIIGDSTVNEGNTLSLTVSAKVADDPDAALDIALGTTTLPEGAVFSLTRIDDNTARFTWEITESDGPGDYEVAFHATTSGGTTRTETVGLSAREVNLPPILTEVYDDWQTGDLFTIDEGQLLALDLAATDDDVPANDLLFSLVGNVPDGAAIDPATGEFTFTPTELHGDLDFEFVIRVTDSGGLFKEGSVPVSVEEVNSPPEFEPVGLQVVSEGLELEVVSVARDPDVPTNQIQYSLVEDDYPEGVEIDAESGKITWDVPDDFLDGHDEHVRLTVLATEVVPEGEKALSATLAIEVMVADDLEEMMAAVSLLQRGGSDPIGLAAPVPAVSAFMDAPAQRGLNSRTTPEDRSGGDFDDRGLFGTEFGIDGGGDQIRPKSKDEDNSAEDSENEQDQPDGEEGDGDGKDGTPMSSRFMLPPESFGYDVADAALEWLFDERHAAGDEEYSTPQDVAPAAESENPPGEEGKAAARAEELAVLLESQRAGGP